MERPFEAQVAVFTRLRRALAGSEIAAHTGFDRCRSLDDCRRLPISDGDSLLPLFARVFERGERIFGSSRLLAIARTSGSQGEPKHVPINRAYLASLDRTLRAVIAFAA